MAFAGPDFPFCGRTQAPAVLPFSPPRGNLGNTAREAGEGGSGEHGAFFFDGSFVVTGSATLQWSDLHQNLTLTGTPNAGATLTFPPGPYELELFNGCAVAVSIRKAGGNSYSLAAGKYINIKLNP